VKILHRSGNLWFCIHEKDLLYSLEEYSEINRNIKEERDVKKQNCLNLYNSEETEENYKVKKVNLKDCYDKEIILLQIPQDSIEIGIFDRIVVRLYTEKVPYFFK
jgi:hypothetical protein